MKKVIISVLVVYLLIGVFIDWNVDSTSRGGLAGSVGVILGWPFIFLNPIH
jgi:hypothetical protein